MLNTFNAWDAIDPERPSGTLIQTDPEAPIGAHPQLGDFDFELHGVTVHSQAFSNVVYHFQRVQDVISSLDEQGKPNVSALLAKTGGESLMATQLARRIKSENYGFQLA